MADEQEDIQEGFEDQPPQDDAGTPASDDGTPAGDTAADQTDAVDHKAELEKLQASHKELQAQFTTVSQDAARNRQLMETLQPFVDYSRMGGQAPEGAGEPEGDEDDEVPLSRKQVREMMSSMAQELRGQMIAQGVRSKYPDVCDNDWKEVIVRNELAKLAKTHSFETPEQRIERAVNKAREILQGERDAGKSEAELARKKADEEARKKAAAAAKASGLETTAGTSPKQQEDDTKPVSADEYASARQSRRHARQTL
jgi:hypothetical protein